MDLNCKDNKCLICNSELEKLKATTIIKACKNKCTTVFISTFDYHLIHIYIFEKVYKHYQEKDIIKEIRYWKKKDRYLTKILEGDS